MKLCYFYLELTRFIRRSIFFCFLSFACGFWSCSDFCESQGLITDPHSIQKARSGPRSNKNQNQLEMSARTCVPDVKMMISFTCLWKEFISQISLQKLNERQGLLSRFWLFFSLIKMKSNSKHENQIFRRFFLYQAKRAFEIEYSVIYFWNFDWNFKIKSHIFKSF